MRKQKFSTRACVATLSVISAAVLAACSSTYQSESTGQFVDSSATTVKVKSALVADKRLKSLPITVKTYKGVVQLSGFVDNDKQRREAVSVASRVEGVSRVEDSLVLK